MYKNNLFEDKEVWYVYIIKFNKDFIKSKYIMWYDKFIDLWYWKWSIKIGSTHNKFRIHNIATELYPDDDLGIENIEILRVIKCTKYRELEEYLHRKFKEKKCKFKREYFNLSDDDVSTTDYDDFWYIWENKHMKILYKQYFFFLKIINASTNNKYWKDKCISYNNLFSSKLNL